MVLVNACLFPVGRTKLMEVLCLCAGGKRGERLRCRCSSIEAASERSLKRRGGGKGNE